MTRQEAFKELIESKQFGKLAGIKRRQDVYGYRARYAAGTLEPATMEKLLEKAGYPVIQEREYGPLGSRKKADK